MKTTSQYASIAAAAAAGALFMYYVDSKRAQPGGASASAGDRVAPRASQGVASGSPEVVEHPTAPARSAWNEQGV